MNRKDGRKEGRTREPSAGARKKTSGNGGKEERGQGRGGREGRGQGGRGKEAIFKSFGVRREKMTDNYLISNKNH